MNDVRKVYVVWDTETGWEYLKILPTKELALSYIKMLVVECNYPVQRLKITEEIW